MTQKSLHAKLIGNVFKKVWLIDSTLITLGDLYCVSEILSHFTWLFFISVFASSTHFVFSFFQRMQDFLQFLTTIVSVKFSKLDHNFSSQVSSSSSSSSSKRFLHCRESAKRQTDLVCLSKLPSNSWCDVYTCFKLLGILKIKRPAYKLSGKLWKSSWQWQLLPHLRGPWVRVTTFTLKLHVCPWSQTLNTISTVERQWKHWSQVKLNVSSVVAF